MRADAEESICTHDLPLAGALPNDNGICDALKLKISEMWRSVGLLHESAVDTAWITSSLDSGFGLNQEFAVPRRILAMRLLAKLHDHNGRSFLDRGLAGIAQKTARVRDNSKW
jgi:hypothetical protein